MPKLREIDETKLVQRADESGNLSRMLGVLDKKCDLVTRHFLLMHIVTETYSRRKDGSKMCELCERVAKLHVREFSTIAPTLSRGDGRLPHVATFQHLATVLTEKGDYTGAVRVCTKAMNFGLTDWTKSGYEGRIERIRNTAKKRRASGNRGPTPPPLKDERGTPQRNSAREFLDLNNIFHLKQR